MQASFMTTAYDFRLPSLEGGYHDLGAWHGRPLLIVNTASQCGFTPQYRALQQVWTVFEKKGLIVLGVPSNDFGQQEPGNTEEIQNFCQKNYGVSFPLTAKSTVHGAEAVPLFQWLAKEGGIFSHPRWNFYKYLINREGHLASWFTPLTMPNSSRLIRTIEHIISI